MTWLNFIDRVVIPTVVAILLVGSLGGLALGCALVFRSDSALQFMARMNSWVSTRKALAPLDVAINVDPVPQAGGRHPLLGAFLAVGGVLAVYFILTRLDFARGAYVPGVDVKRWFLTGLAMEGMKWVLVAGSVFAVFVGAMMFFAPLQLAAFEQRMNQWQSSEPLLAADEKMHMPLEPRVAANPRAAGWTIAVASLLVALAMIGLLIYRHQ